MLYQQTAMDEDHLATLSASTTDYSNPTSWEFEPASSPSKDPPQKPSEAPILPIKNLPSEIISTILDFWIGEPTLFPADPYHPTLLTPTYTSSIPPQILKVLPLPLQHEHNLLLHQKWLRSEKSFDDAYRFYATHIAVLGSLSHGAFEPPRQLRAMLCQQAVLPEAMRPHPQLRLHGLEKIRLDLTAADYFALFRVHVPPFERPGSTLHDQEPYGAAVFLAHTEQLVLCFGDLFRSTHPWYDLADTAWDGERDDGVVPRCRPGVCTEGLLIDWILTYAWHHGYLQHIPKIKLQGGMQPWVREKWMRIFEGGDVEEGFAGEAHIERIGTIGLQEAVAQGMIWDPAEHYPPKCACEIPCGRLGGDAECESDWDGDCLAQGSVEPWGEWDWSTEEAVSVVW
ncbi:hypothetical protein BU26DRAFT_111091 [Trematosphaeria pertusa]|uniref:Uncharacterized protein n=1 Tax=Trematosphaeria pertusa TaxID=390896 RepID=A0A6A6I1B5_9PLEO|nr:uncharacterized protein BU26DRAFT_111091 [Trematosphaeria pertusa]KAF2243939.1 hypothetical protein BU26DRAFT_111091 [Trematosphaeria pertusa]